MKKIAYVICLILFLIPFFWFKPGEMDLGGDSSRLYFYDPVLYLTNHSFYGISPSSFGFENISYFALPFVSLLVILKYFVHSPTILISIFHGLALSLGFLGCYLSIKELLKDYKSKSKLMVEISAVSAGIFYSFSQINISGWDKVILTHDQFFLNPIQFYLLLRYVLTKNPLFLMGSLIISFFFSHNYSFVGAPPFFAFYPLAAIFIVCYALFVRKATIPIKGLFIGLIIFVLLQSFHLVPQLFNLFATKSSTYAAIFSPEAKYDRGLGYFTGVASVVKVSKSIYSLPQLTDLEVFQFVYILIPFILLFGFIKNKSKTYLLTGAFFLLILFLVSANITNVGFSFYKSLFAIPGFAIFRNFFGQWAYIYQFFYALMLGQAVLILVTTNKKYYVRAIPILLISYLVLSAYPFINGSLTNKTLWQSKNKKIVMTMDPTLEDALRYTRQLPQGKVLTLPLSDTGSQMVVGKNDGIYQGPSLVAYLSGKQDFAGINEFGIYQPLISQYFAEKNYDGLQNLLIMLGVRYIFYDSDTEIYDTFSAFPYYDVRQRYFLPKDQKSYKEFLNHLKIKEVYANGVYHVYQIISSDSTIYAPKSLIPTSSSVDSWSFYFNSALFNKEIAIVPEDVLSGTDSDLFLKVDSIPYDKTITTDYPIPVLYPFVRWQPNSVIYFLLALKEKRSIEKLKNSPLLYSRESMNLALKRISELQKWGNELPIKKDITENQDIITYWHDVQLSNINQYDAYNSWEAGLSRYFQTMRSAGEVFANPPESVSSEYGELWRNYIHQINSNQKRLEVVVGSLHRPTSDKKYLISIIDQQFEKLHKNISETNSNDINFEYFVWGDKAKGNDYAFYAQNKEGIINRESTLVVGNTVLNPDEVGNSLNLHFVPNVSISKNIFATLHTYAESTKIPLVWRPSKDIFPVGGLKKQTGEKLTIDRKKYDALINKETKLLGDGKYLISFDYLTSGESFEVNLFLKAKKKKTDKTDPAYLGVFRESVNSRSWRKFNAIFDTNQTETTVLGIKSLNGQNMQHIEIKNLSIKKIDNNPAITVQKVHAQLPTLQPPKLHIARINPTKYVVDVKKATTPFILILSEQFSNNWKVFKSTQPTNILWAKQNAGEKHFIANGYANAWWIYPNKMGGSDFTLVIEWQPQNIFYISLFVSSVTFILLCIAFLYKLFQYGKN